MLKAPNPLLSAIPRSNNILSAMVHSQGLASLHSGSHPRTIASAPWRATNKRQLSTASYPVNTPSQPVVDDEIAYDGSSSTNDADENDKMSDEAIHSPIDSPGGRGSDVEMGGDADAVGSPCSVTDDGEAGGSAGERSAGSGSVENKAAKLLMKLSCKDGEISGSSVGIGGSNSSWKERGEEEGRRVKRRRGASL
jgi:hypothetical protein